MFHPVKPAEVKQLDNKGTKLMVDYTYCLGFEMGAASGAGVLVKDYVYSDRVSLPGAGVLVANAVCRVKAASEPDWRVSYRKQAPEQDPLNINPLRRRLEHQRSCKFQCLTCRHDGDFSVLRILEKQAAKRRAKEMRQRAVIAVGLKEATCSEDSESE